MVLEIKEKSTYLSLTSNDKTQAIILIANTIIAVANAAMIAANIVRSLLRRLFWLFLPK